MSIPTPFETNARKTTLEEEAAFLAQVDAESPLMSYARIGSSVQGRRIDLVRLGTPEPRVAPPYRRPLFVTAVQHANEPAGREGALAFIRDLAYGATPAFQAYLAEHDVFVIPTCNPDGFLAVTAENAHGVNLNRDHIAHAEPETQTIAQAVRHVRPHVTVDLHEGEGTITTATEILYVTNPQADAGIQAVSKQLVDHCIAHLQAGGITSAYYNEGGTGEEIARNSLGLRHHVAMLTESRRLNVTLDVRVAAQRRILEGVVDWHTANSQDVASTIEAARLVKADEGTAGTVPFDLGNATVLDPPPLGYRLTASQYAQVQPVFALLGIITRGEDGSTDRIVPMGQTAQPLIPFMCDPSSLTKLVDGTRLAALPAAPQTPFGLRVDGLPMIVTGYRRDGQETPILGYRRAGHDL